MDAEEEVEQVGCAKRAQMHQREELEEDWL